MRKVILHNAVSACFGTDSFAWVELAGYCLAAGFAAEDELCWAGTARVAQGEKGRERKKQTKRALWSCNNGFLLFLPSAIRIITFRYR